eukprot:7894168-Pyramimonas_sp.AAC.1
MPLRRQGMTPGKQAETPAADAIFTMGDIRLTIPRSVFAMALRHYTPIYDELGNQVRFRLPLRGSANPVLLNQFGGTPPQRIRHGHFKYDQ